MQTEIITPGDVQTLTITAAAATIAAPWQPRQGQWVKFAGPDVPGAHHAGDLAVGIFQRAGRVAVTVLADGKLKQQGEWLPDRVEVCDPRGLRLMATDAHGTPGHVLISIDRITDLRPVESRDDIPAARLATIRDDWHPRA